MSPRATLIIPTYQRQHLALPLLEQIKQQTSQDFETLFVDQSPKPNEALITMCGERVRYLHADHASLPNARNIGAQEAKGEILIYIDDDVTVDPAFIEGHLAAFEDQAIHATAGRILGGYDDGPTPSPASVGRFSPWTATVTRNFHGKTPVKEIEQLPGGNFAIRRGTYLKLGGFDLAAFGGRASIGEETDFACRLHAAGGRIDFVPKALLNHDHAEEGGCREDRRREWTYWHAHNFTTLALRYLALWRWPVFFVVFALRYLVHGLRAMNPLVTLAGWKGLLTPFLKIIHPPETLQTFGGWVEYPKSNDES